MCNAELRRLHCLNKMCDMTMNVHFVLRESFVTQLTTEIMTRFPQIDSES